ncbi:hypothetical protein [Alteromonas sp. S015]|uniref:hypothetical protein n=1 Tax=Alteromonas sp. S015 TaxID=3117401 RepID=UPI002FE1B3BB
MTKCAIATSRRKREPKVFSFLLIRTLVGVIALTIPFLVTYTAGTDLSSISASYYTDARDWFVGLLFAVAAFLFAYNGRSIVQCVLSKIASLAAMGVALSPTTREGCNNKLGKKVETNLDTACKCICDVPNVFCECIACDPVWIGIAHYVAAAILFFILTIFCFFIFFRETGERIDGEERSQDEKFRHWIYFVCSIFMFLSMIGLLLYFFKWAFTDVKDFVYWAEALALVSFGFAWTVSGKWIPGLTKSR